MNSPVAPSDLNLEAPLLSIVTICYNSAATLEDTFQSLAPAVALHAREVEYLIIDGGSKDATPELLARYARLTSRVVSEPDRGIYDAMNKGLRLARGQYVWFLNADDMLASTAAFTQLLQALRLGKSIVITDIDLVSAANTQKVVRRWQAMGWFNQLGLGWHPPHPGFIARRELLSELGGFDLRYRIAADVDLMTRAWRVALAGHSTDYLEVTLVRMRAGGASNSGLAAIARANRECLQSFWSQGMWLAPLAVGFKLLRKVGQLVRTRSTR
jgi:glycosyltransferase involved in cell wall biosynthesis